MKRLLMKPIFILAISSILIIQMNGQNKLSYGLIGGINVSGIYSNYSMIREYPHNIETIEAIHPTLGLNTGVFVNYSMTKHWRFNTELIYQTSEIKYEMTSVGSNILTEIEVNDSYTELHKFEHFKVPVYISYDFNLCKIPAYINLGAVPSFMIKGERKEIHSSLDPQYSYTTTQNLNDLNDVYSEELRYETQILVGLGASHKNVSVSINYLVGNHTSYLVGTPPGFCATGYFRSFQNKNLLLTLQYDISRLFEKDESVGTLTE